jgi:hypothetical protein
MNEKLKDLQSTNIKPCQTRKPPIVSEYMRRDTNHCGIAGKEGTEPNARNPEWIDLPPKKFSKHVRVESQAHDVKRVMIERMLGRSRFLSRIWIPGVHERDVRDLSPSSSIGPIRQDTHGCQRLLQDGTALNPMDFERERLFVKSGPTFLSWDSKRREVRGGGIRTQHVGQRF